MITSDGTHSKIFILIQWTHHTDTFWDPIKLTMNDKNIFWSEQKFSKFEGPFEAMESVNEHH